MHATPPQRDALTAEVRLAPGKHRRVAAGHLWVYQGEIQRVVGTPASGDVIDVVSATRDFIGRGFFNPQSKIAVRLLTRQREPIDEAFWRAAIQRAGRFRERFVHDTTAYRLVHGESDGLPGLIVDRYHDTLVMQTLSAGMATRKDDVARLLRDITGVSAVYLRNDPKSLAQEGVPQETRYLFGEGRSVVSIDEGSARFEVDIVRGHKTGWFCDQRENRLAVAGLVQGAHVLDAFCHTGGFSIHAALGGATSVTGIDVSSDAVAAARRHAELNGVSNRCRFEIGDVFETLRAMERAGRRFDLVILDPPAFARAKPAVARALAGYKDINLLACRLLKPEGVLISCSCSHHVSEAQLCDAIRAAAHDARRTLRVLEIRGQARDHPVLADMPETRYLKCFLLQVV